MIFSKHPASVIVLRVLTCDSKMMPRHFFDCGQGITAPVYLKVLHYVVVPWLQQAYPDGNLDGSKTASAHATDLTVEKFTLLIILTNFCLISEIKKARYF